MKLLFLLNLLFGFGFCDVWDDLANAEINGMPEEEQQRLRYGFKLSRLASNSRLVDTNYVQ